jgi:actin-like protein 6A
MFAMPSSTMSSFCLGRATSLVVDLGAGGTTITPVVDGYELKKAIVHTDIGGNYVDYKLAELLRSERGGELPKPWYNCEHKLNYRPDFRPSSSYFNLHQHDIVRDVKHWMCLFPHYRVGAEFRSVEGLAQLGLILPPKYELPDGTFVDTNYQICTIAENIFFPEAPCKPSDEMQVVTEGDLPPPVPAKPKKRARELLSNPEMEIVSEQEALHDLLYLAAGRADVDTRREMLGNIALVGGGSNFGGLQPRLSKELSEVIPSNYKVSLCGLFLSGCIC